MLPAREVPVRVEVPVKVVVSPPLELVLPYAGPTPTWVLPMDKGASSCLTLEGEAAIRDIVRYHVEQQAALEAWRGASR